MSLCKELIHRWELAPHPEGGWYKEVHRSPALVIRKDGQTRPGLTSILFLLDAASISRWHRVRGADEMWVHLQGAPLELFSLAPAGGRASSTMLSPDHPIQVIPADHWQAARPQGSYALVSCCVGPGFDFADFDLLHDLVKEQWPPGALEELI
ncbi:conserved hypothetical protein DUF985 [Synechococcus sp. RS9909]|uniref:cupin domain-containing protein n=1 Tax=unclassified Synechococcus TaxID=2626047 RepID=UPI0000690975|nr:MULTISPECIES: cupin domain-containing protein [unclassified Synechococcus]EAQ68619.1 hypothetical protein RS9917_03518 [Synechococcus sp. RS9917]QNI78472.1 conserved hypothetical protein DUF985 [Synechococcus sp. RS9909]